MNAPLHEKLKNVEWGEYEIGDLFEKLNLRFLKPTFDKENDISKEKSLEFNLPLVNAKDGNNGVMYYGRSQDFESAEMTIDIVNDGAVSTGNVYPQPQKTGVLYNAYLIKPKFSANEKLLHFFTSIIFKSIKHKFGYENKAGWDKVKQEKIQLPIKNNEIDFVFMESFIAEIEAERIENLKTYLTVVGLNDYTLTTNEQKVLKDFENGKVEYNKFVYKSVFNKIVQGRRLKKDDQILGDIPFVMAGTTNAGIVNYISNPVASFPKNSITVDIFGNAFYRNYDFGAGDDTGVYWNDEKEYSKETMLFFTAAIEKSLLGKFDFGKKLRSSQSLNFNIQLPTKNNHPDYKTMETLISAVIKLVIKDVVLYMNKKSGKQKAG
ncbi:MAG: restriction endonuclease subunit S [Chloroflexi bacterium]|nr:restriction endonuclease subunit S [Chloroflexota bacterium]